MKKFQISQINSIMKFLKVGAVIFLSGVFSLTAFAHDPKGESFKLSGKITSVELTDDGGTITVSSEAGRYGKVFLTYNVKLNPALPDQGYFSGRVPAVLLWECPGPRRI